jgi:hypothetical protein
MCGAENYLPQGKGEQQFELSMSVAAGDGILRYFELREISSHYVVISTEKVFEIVTCTYTLAGTNWLSILQIIVAIVVLAH